MTNLKLYKKMKLPPEGIHLPMRLEIYQSAEEFYKVVMPWLRQNEGINLVAIGVLEIQNSPNPLYDKAYYGAVFGGDNLMGVGIMTPPHPLNINGKTIDVVPYFLEMAKQIPAPKSILGPGEFAKRFAELWIKETGATVSRREAQAIHKLTKVIHPEIGLAKMIVAEDRHLKLVQEWSQQFCIDCGMDSDTEEVNKRVCRSLEGRTRFLLTVGDRPVSMADWGRRTGTMGAISWVFTPENERKKGYGSAITALLSQRILDSGCEAVYLYTQLDNPTSNKIYYNIGFRVISDSWHISFT